MILARINPWNIIKRHFATFCNYETGKLCWIEIIVLTLLAIALGGVSFFIGNEKVQSLGAALFSALTILAGFLINAIVLLTGKKSEILKGENSLNADYRNLVFDTFNNISFGVLVSIVAMCLCMLISLLPQSYVAWFGFFLLLNLFFLVHTLLLVVKRLHKIFLNEIGS